MRRAGLLLAVLLLSMAVWGSAPVAKARPPASPSVDSGILYFWGQTGVWSIKPDGSGMTLLFSWTDFPFAFGAGVTPMSLESSYAKHGNARWFLTTLPVFDDTGAEETWPDGTVRQELFALSAAGDAVQLTDGRLYSEGAVSGWIAPDPHNPRWSKYGSTEDGLVSFFAQEYEWGPGAGQATLVEGGSGLYAVTFDPDVLPEATSLGLAPSLVGAPVPFEPDRNGWSSWGYDWSPDGNSIIYAELVDDASTPENERGIYRADLVDGEWVVTDGNLYVNGQWPRWSRTGDSTKDRIVFQLAGIRSMKPDGTDPKLLAEPTFTNKYSKRVFYPCWSPAGINVAYYYETQDNAWTTWTGDLYRVGADGSGQTNLTKTTSEYVNWPLGWRAE